MKYFILLFLFSAAVIKAQTNHLINNSGWNNNYNPTFRKAVYYSNNPANKFSTADTQFALTKVGQWGWGPCSDAAVQGNYVYIGNGYLFQVLDVSDPASPKVVGQLSMEYPVYRVRVEGNYAYVTYPFNIIDISDPANPVLVTIYNIPTAAAGPTAEAINGNYAYLGDGLGFVYIIDISDRSNPKEIGKMRTAGEVVEYIAVKDTVLYASTNDNDVNIFNIANPEAPFWIPSQIPYVSVPLAIDGKYIYTGSGTLDGEFQMYDITDLYNPRLVNGIALNIDSEYTSGILFTTVSIVDTIAYLTGVVDTVPYYPHFNEILFAIDIADTNNIHIISKLTNPYNASDYYGWGFGGGGISFPLAYYATNTGLWTVNLQRPDSMKSLSYFPTGWYVNKITVDSSYHAYLAESFGGLKILDFSNSSSPKMIGGYYSPGEQVIDAVVSGSYAYLDCDSGLQIVDISNSASPTLISKISFNDSTPNFLGYFDFLCLDGSTIYAARKSQKLFVIDIRDLVNPQIVSIISLRGIPVGISQSNGYLYVANMDQNINITENTGVQIFNISITNTPVESRFLKVVGLGGIATNKNSLFVMGDDTTSKKYGLEKYDITNPVEPIFKYFVNVPGSFGASIDIKVDKNYAYIPNDNTLNIINISNPDSGKIVYAGYGGTPVAVYNDIVVTGYLGVEIFKNNLITGITSSNPTPTNFKLFQNYPNPFNPSTEISYQLSAVNKVTLKVYNILGQEIKTLVSNIQKSGKHTVRFDASNLSSGIYFYCIVATSGDKKYTSAKKMVLLK